MTLDIPMSDLSIMQEIHHVSKAAKAPEQGNILGRRHSIKGGQIVVCDWWDDNVEIFWDSVARNLFCESAPRRRIK